jgi:hypothetical protein
VPTVDRSFLVPMENTILVVDGQAFGDLSMKGPSATKWSLTDDWNVVADDVLVT